ncbi:MAG: hypothetical protein ABIX01_09985 [Chitinophagaceae bacterium]
MFTISSGSVRRNSNELLYLSSSAVILLGFSSRLNIIKSSTAASPVRCKQFFKSGILQVNLNKPMNFLKNILNGILGIVGILVGYVLIRLVLGFIVYLFEPNSSATKVVEVVGALLAIWAIIEAIKKTKK